MKISIDTEKLTVSIDSERLITIHELEFLHSTYEVILEDLRLECQYMMELEAAELNTKLNIFDGAKPKIIPSNS